jgi:hypothetical protein
MKRYVQEIPSSEYVLLKVNDPTTWWEADEIVEVNDPKLGRLKISQWKELHFRSSAAHDMSLIRVERLNRKREKKNPRPLWLVWVGEQFAKKSYSRPKKSKNQAA